MKSALKIVFMGTPDFAVASLEKLISKSFDIVGVITAPDRPAGRGRKLRESAVKQFAVSRDLKILQPLNLKDPGFIEELKVLKADLQIVVAFRMLPRVVWSMPQYGTFNLHASLLPDYRGAAPINWAVINGETETGVTTFFLDEKIDTGKIILQKKTPIYSNENAGDLHDRLMEIGSELVVETVDLISKDQIQTEVQENRAFKEAPKLTKENCRIDWNDSGMHIFNMIRGLSPYPGAWTMLSDHDKMTELKIYGTEWIKEVHNFPAGKVLTTKKEIRIAVKDGYMLITDLKLSGKRRMDVVSLLNGFTFTETVKML